MTLGLGATRRKRPIVPEWIDGYAKGALTELELDVKVTGLGYIYDDFDSVDDWVNVHGRLRTTGGATSDVYGPDLGYAAGYHKTQLLTDNCRAKVTIQSESILYGQSRVWICGDNRMTRYYGLAIGKSLLSSYIVILRGKSSISVDTYENTNVTLSSGDEFEIWYDRPNSTVRVYQNGSEIASKYFPPNDIPHGPGNRWCGVVMATDWLVDLGPNFDDFTAWDVAAPLPDIYDPVDQKVLNSHWVTVSGEAEVHTWLAFPRTIGPESAGHTTAALRWDTQISTDSVKVVVTLHRFGVGKYNIAVCSNTGMTNWLGVQFDATTDKIAIVTGSGPTTVTSRINTDHIVVQPIIPQIGWYWTHNTHYEPVRTGMQYTIQYDYTPNVIKVFKGNNLGTPLLEWEDAADVVSHGSGHRYVAQSWVAGLLTPGVEPMAFEAFAVTADQPLP